MQEELSFGIWLRKQRRALDITRRAFANQVGCAEVTLRHIEAGILKPSKELASILLEKLGIPETERTQWISFARGISGFPSKSIPVSNQPLTNLPAPLTSFVGREKVQSDVIRLITKHRLVTLIGAGGVGKTRLSIKVGETILRNYPDGVWLVELAPILDPLLVTRTTAIAIGLRDEPQRPVIDMLSDYLQKKKLLIILDNCEHLLDACAQLADTLLKHCPNLKILVTSREALGVLGEAVYPVPSLELPDFQQLVEKFRDYESVRLFEERAQLVHMDFSLTIENAVSIAKICSRLDGIPLAIELAAARVKMFSTEQIAERLQESFSLLTTGNRTALPRHQTLHATIDWSYELLSPAEQALFRRLSVFINGWTLEAVQSICSDSKITFEDILDLLTQLTNKSLVIKEETQHKARYHMLETIRQYARGRLIKAGDDEQIRGQHLEFFLHWGEQAGPRVRGPQQLEWLNRIEAEHDNLRAALEWSLTQAEYGEMSLRLAGALFLFWNRRGSINEGRVWLARALASPAAPIAGAARAQALYADGWLAHSQSDTTAQARLEESVSLWRACGPRGKIGLAYALAELGEEMRWRGDPDRARSLHGEAITLFRKQDERWGLAYSLSRLGMAIRDKGDFALARSVINESVTLWRDLGELWELGVSIRFLGLVALRQGDYEVALHHFADYLAINRRLGNEVAVAVALSDMGEATLNLGDRVQAKSLIEESFSIFREANYKFGIAPCLYFSGLLAGFEGDSEQATIFFEQGLALAHTTGPIWYRGGVLMGLAGVAAANRQALRAARLLGAADTQLEAGASYWNAAESLYIEHTVASAVAQLGEAEFAAARAEGQAMTFEQAAAYALETEPSG